MTGNSREKLTFRIRQLQKRLREESKDTSLGYFTVSDLPILQELFNHNNVLFVDLSEKQVEQIEKRLARLEEPSTE